MGHLEPGDREGHAKKRGRWAWAAEAIGIRCLSAQKERKHRNALHYYSTQSHLDSYGVSLGQASHRLIKCLKQAVADNVAGADLKGGGLVAGAGALQHFASVIDALPMHGDDVALHSAQRRRV